MFLLSLCFISIHLRRQVKLSSSAAEGSRQRCRRRSCTTPPCQSSRSTLGRQSTWWCSRIKLREQDRRWGACGGGAIPEAKHLGWGWVYTLRELEAAMNGLSDGNVISEGGYGIVYRNVLANHTLVVVKNLLNNRVEKGFKVGVEAIGRVRHKNLVKLLGYCGEGTYRLSYLHKGLEPKVVHRDIKTSNMLLHRHWNPKVNLVDWLKTMVGNRKSEEVVNPKLSEMPASKALKRVLLERRIVRGPSRSQQDFKEENPVVSKAGEDKQVGQPWPSLEMGSRILVSPSMMPWDIGHEFTSKLARDVSKEVDVISETTEEVTIFDRNLKESQLYYSIVKTLDVIGVVAGLRHEHLGPIFIELNSPINRKYPRKDLGALRRRALFRCGSVWVSNLPHRPWFLPLQGIAAAFQSRKSAEGLSLLVDGSFVKKCKQESRATLSAFGSKRMKAGHEIPGTSLTADGLVKEDGMGVTENERDHPAFGN
ncbi:protein kinase superfamily protein [Actinidia rufa]|uniref:non-specific serine/threonine protein kinase n=1 Tax=Actinidia rufa TaxID=165716 RepID=A0A7J0F1F5_9ERIC|nr:protein kinase superfamily protein [Actinidia rufa]